MSRPIKQNKSLTTNLSQYKTTLCVSELGSGRRMCREIPISYTHSVMRLHEEASPILNSTYIISSPCPMLSKSRLEKKRERTKCQKQLTGKLCRGKEKKKRKLNRKEKRLLVKYLVSASASTQLKFALAQKSLAHLAS